ncbi:hypothetical protein FA95DRAFT_1610247 [Auriscalpium vulgare]|uniref:Uncharacterized protein n=1 Tax=Auriscalpium vulgare TaxID=40419 RepID=A0ACB8RFG7_9AGAM|nr:hypothetical protein FA95DRAFT_1610247 [Auriscalpium vulgare]
MPPVLSNKVVLEVGDLYIHVHHSKSKRIDVRQIWILQQDKDGKKYWQQRSVLITLFSETGF